jgi:hypothetical protein
MSVHRRPRHAIGRSARPRKPGCHRHSRAGPSDTLASFAESRGELSTAPATASRPLRASALSWRTRRHPAGSASGRDEVRSRGAVGDRPEHPGTLRLWPVRAAVVGSRPAGQTRGSRACLTCRGAIVVVVGTRHYARAEGVWWTMRRVAWARPAPSATRPAMRRASTAWNATSSWWMIQSTTSQNRPVAARGGLRPDRNHGGADLAQAKTWAAFDVHVSGVVAATLDRDSGELRLQRLPGRSEDVAAFAAALPGPVRATYEAGPTGFVLARRLRAAGIECLVCAPGLIPRGPSDRVKTDRRDAERLVRLLAAGELHPVAVPSVEAEALRDLVRARGSARRLDARGAPVGEAAAASRGPLRRAAGQLDPTASRSSLASIWIGAARHSRGEVSELALEERGTGDGPTANRKTSRSPPLNARTTDRTASLRERLSATPSPLGSA